MDAAVIIQLLQSVVASLPSAITTVEQLYELGTKFAGTIKGSKPTDDEITALRTQIDSDVATALTPLPPAQPGDPDYVAPTA